jgi:hypothetical protein
VLPAAREATPRRDGPFYIGAGPGTTGTRTFSRGLQQLGFKVQHWQHFNRYNTTWYFHTKASMEQAHFQSDFSQLQRDMDVMHAVFDTPVSNYFFELYAAFSDSRVLLSTRSPLGWARSRLGKHGTAQLDFPLGVGKDRIKMNVLSQTEIAQAFTLYNWLILCLVPPQRLFEVSLTDMHDQPDQKWRELCDFVGAGWKCANMEGFTRQIKRL